MEALGRRAVSWGEVFAREMQIETTSSQTPSFLSAPPRNDPLFIGGRDCTHDRSIWLLGRGPGGGAPRRPTWLGL